MPRPEPDYSEDFHADASGVTASLRELARAMFEDAPAPVRWFLLIGWRAVLGLRLGPMHSPAHVLGWQITELSPDKVLLTAESPRLTSTLVLTREGETVNLASDVWYLTRSAAPLWGFVRPIHRLIAPRLLRRSVAGARASVS